MSAAEDMVKLLQSKPSPWELEGDMSVFTDGLADMLARIQALEAAMHVARPDIAADHGVAKPSAPAEDEGSETDAT